MVKDRAILTMADQ